jgi:hypothetical protein
VQSRYILEGTEIYAAVFVEQPFDIGYTVHLLALSHTQTQTFNDLPYFTINAVNPQKAFELECSTIGTAEHSGSCSHSFTLTRTITAMETLLPHPAPSSLTLVHRNEL